MFLQKYKVILVTLLLLLVIESVVSAAPNRFQTIYYDQIPIGQFDTQTLKYEKEPYRNVILLNVWVKTPMHPIDKTYTLYNYLYSTKTQEMVVLDQIDFDLNGQIINKISNQYNPSLWDKILPETLAERRYLAVSEYAKINAKKLQKEYNEQMDKNKAKNSNNLPAPFNHVFDFLSGN